MVEGGLGPPMRRKTALLVLGRSKRLVHRARHSLTR